MKKESFFLEEIKKSKNYSLHKENTDIRIRLAQKVLKKRKESGLSQEKLAKQTKATQSIISEIESADYNIGLELLGRIATALKMDDQDIGEVFNASISVTEFKFDKTEEVTDDLSEAMFNLNN